MAAHSGSKIKFKDYPVLFSLDTRNRAKGTFEGPPILNYAVSSEGTQSTNISERQIPAPRKLRKLTKYKHKPVRVTNSTSDWVDLKSTGTDVVLADGETIIVSLYVFPYVSANRFNCQLNVINHNTNMAIGSPSNLPAREWSRISFTWTNNTGATQTVTSTRIETYTNESWTGSKVNCAAVNFQVEKAITGITSEPTPYTNETSTRSVNRETPFGNSSIDYSTASYSPGGKYLYFDGTGETDGSPTGSYISIPSALCTTNPATRPNGVTYSWWQYCKDLQRRSLFFGAGTINHIENNPPNFRTETVLRNNESFGAGNANQTANTWENYSIVFDNVNIQVTWYKNGKQIHTETLLNANGVHDYFQPNSIGRATGSSAYLYAKSHYGYFDCFYVHEGAMSQEEVARVYTANRSYFESLEMP